MWINQPTREEITQKLERVFDGNIELFGRDIGY